MHSRDTKKCLIFILLVGMTVPAVRVDAVRINKDGLMFTKEDAYSLIASVVIGGVTYGALRAFQSGESSSTHNKRLISSGAAALVGGGVTYLIATYFNAKNKTDIENYINAQKEFETVSESPLMTTQFDSFMKFVVDHYETKEPFGAALREFNGLQEQLNDAHASLDVLLDSINQIIKRMISNKGDFMRKVKN